MAHGEEQTIKFRISRQEGPRRTPSVEIFHIPYRPNMNVISCLIEIAKDPVTSSGVATSPVQWDCACLEEVCGACTMLINGKPRQACSALIDNLEQPITLEPLTKFPLVRDLCVDRSRMFDSLKKVKAWVPLDGMYDLGEGPKMSPETQEIRYDLSRCMTCSCCMEVCPQFGPDSSFIGPAPIGQAALFNLHPTGALLAGERLETMMEEGGVHECGNAQNCVRACPKDIKLTEAIADIGRSVTGHAVKRFFGRG